MSRACFVRFIISACMWCILVRALHALCFVLEEVRPYFPCVSTRECV